MRIDWDLKLGFKDVMIRPKRSTLASRSEVSLERKYKFKHSQKNLARIPYCCFKYGYCWYFYYGK